jgi:hypothetical protein
VTYSSMECAPWVRTRNKNTTWVRRSTRPLHLAPRGILTGQSSETAPPLADLVYKFCRENRHSSVAGDNTDVCITNPKSAYGSSLMWETSHQEVTSSTSTVAPDTIG